MKDKIRIGCGAGFSGDRLDPALILVEKGGLDYLVLECLAERTIALAQKRKLQNPALGYDPLLERRIESLLPLLAKNKVCLITNMGAANPLEGAKKVADIARKMGIKVRVAAVFGDDVFEQTDPGALALETGKALVESGELISANAYLGIEGILKALENKADIVITGRVADPSLFLAPMVFELGWDTGNYDLMGKGTVAGHLLECAGHITGGYFADPVKKPVEGLDILGHPFADVFADGSAIIGKVEGTGGVIDLRTAKEQLLYEVVNPREYVTPDVVADFSTVILKETGKDRVLVRGGTGKTKPPTCKVSIGYRAFYLGEGEISYAGATALERAKLAGEILEKRLKNKVEAVKTDYIGLSSAHRTLFSAPALPYEIRLRVAGKAASPELAALVGEEVEALYTNGPAGGGGVRKYVNEVIGIVSTLMDRTQIRPEISFFES